MASLFRLKSGQWTIDVHTYGRIRLGRNKAEASLVFVHVEAIEHALKYSLSPPPATLSWLRTVEGKLAKRLVKLGLSAFGESKTIGDLCSATMRTTVKARTQNVYENTNENLKRFFGTDQLLSDISTADALGFKDWMLEKGRRKKHPEKGLKLAVATVSKRFKRSRAMFEWAIDAEWISKNPFKGIKPGKQTNPSRAFFVSRDIADRVLEDLPSPELRLAFALGRYGGLRLPSEALDLKWEGVDWSRRSFTFRSVKTEAHPGKESRTCPIFPELSRYLLEAQESAAIGEPYALPRLRSWEAPGQMLTKMIRQSLKRLNIDPWAKTLVNLRATRATEIDAEFGAKAESEWIGHGSAVALQHYLMMTDEVFDRATGKIPSTGPRIEKIKTEK